MKKKSLYFALGTVAMASMLMGTVCMAEEDDPIVIGACADISGNFAAFGAPAADGMKVAVDEINANGGINGRRVELLMADLQTNDAIAQQVVNKYIYDDEVDVVIGEMSSSAREAVRVTVDKAGTTPFFYTCHYEGGVADHYTFCSGESNTDMCMGPIMEAVLSEMEDPKIYLFLPDYNFGEIMYNNIVSFAEQCGAEIVGYEYIPLDQSQFSTTIANIVAADPDAVIACPVGTNQAAFYEQWQVEGIKDIPLISVDACVETYEHLTFDKGVMNNVYCATSFCEELDTENAKAFTEKVREIDPSLPYVGTEANNGYNAVYFYKAAVELAGTTDTEAVIAALESGECVVENAPCGTIRMRGEDHHTERSITFFRVDENNQMNKIGTTDGVVSTLVEDKIKEAYGIDGGLKGLSDAGEEAPNIQYTILD